MGREKLNPLWYTAINTTTRDKDKVLEVIKQRTYKGEKVIARVASCPVESIEAVRDAAREALETDDMSIVGPAIKDAYLCTWDIYAMAFFENAMEENKKEHEFTQDSFLEAVEAGLGTVINMGGILIGVMRPETEITDEEGSLHCETGPAVVWGEDVRYFWHGTQIGAEWIEDRDNRTAVEALSERNIEKRRAYCEIIGWHNIIDELGGEVIDKDEDPKIGTLLSINLPDAPDTRFLKVLCGTGRTFAISVPPEIKTAIQAQAESYGITEEQAREAAKYRT